MGAQGCGVLLMLLHTGTARVPGANVFGCLCVSVFVCECECVYIFFFHGQIFHISLELVAKLEKTSLKVALVA